ncbi:ABC transporter permease [Streptacidiphilus cavernicola]|uniref:ABC transporter permease n=1 Tax=Streptacidiphilus cavernicola TaxID=3342716 RepID=A0ABV6W2N3_9ACTN
MLLDTTALRTTAQPGTSPRGTSPRGTALRTTALVRHNTVLLLREPGPLASRMILPLVFVTLLRPLYTAAEGTAAGTVQAVTGTLVTFSLLALSIVGGAILTERLWHTWERLRSSAAHPLEILTGKALPVLGALLAQQVLVLGFGAAVLGMRLDHLPLLGLALLCWTLTLLGIGSALGVAARTHGELSAAYDIGGMLLSSLGGAFVPLAALPHWVRAVAPASPGYWGVSALHAALAGDVSRVLACGAVLLGFTLAAGLLAVRGLRRASSRSVL